MRWFRVLIFLSCSISAMGQSQNRNYTPGDLLSQASVFQWTGENGLISNNVTSALQAKTGFIWITSYNGIMRFDGKSVEVYDRKTIPFLSTDAFYRVYEDKKGVLWFASQGSGIIKYDGFKFSPVDSVNTIIPKSIRCLYIEDDSKIWIGSNNSGLYYLENNIPHHVSNPLINGTNILDIDQDLNKTLWIATDGNGVVAYDGKNFTHYNTQHGLSSNTINSIEATDDGDVLIGTTNGLNLFSEGKITSVDFLQDVPINDIVKGIKGWIWVATENGLARIEKGKNIVDYVTEKDGYPFARINNISFDNEGSIWLSTGRNGLVQVKQTGIVNFTTTQGLAMNRINIIVEGPNKTFYIGSDAGDINVYKNGEIKRIPIQTQLTNASIRDICEDDKGNLWIASYRGILKISGRKEKLFTLQDGLPAIDMRRVLKDRKGNLWFASRSGGVIKFNNDHVIATYNRENGLGANYVLSLEEDSLGNIYVGTHSGGLTIISRDGTPAIYHITPNDAGVLIFNIEIDQKRGSWIVSNSGIYLFNGSAFKKMELEGLHKGETFFDIINDFNDNIWITSNIGVLKINSVDIERYLTGSTQSVPFKLFDNQDGMKNKECTGATRSLLSSSGRIWIPTIGGVSVFYPDKIFENRVLPPVYITSLVTDKKISYLNKASIPPGNLRYVFNYTALSYLSPTKVKFKYKLEDVDPDWVDAGSSRQTEYTNLRPGNYTFRVIACNNDGLWNRQGATMHFTVEPFFYQTYWFYGFSITLVLLLFYAIYKWRVYRVEQRNTELHKLNNELDRFVYSTSHDLRAPLASILGLVNLSRLEDKNKDYYINLIEQSVKKLDEFIREIIDYSRNARLDVEPTAIDFERLANSTLENLEYLDEQNAISKTISIINSYPFYSDKIRIGIILSNLLSNAIKYYNPAVTNPSVALTITLHQTQAIIRVTDNGIGIAEEHLETIFKMFFRGSDRSKGSGLGLYIVKETVEKLGGTITVQSTLNEGSTFEVVLPSLKKEK